MSQSFYTFTFDVSEWTMLDDALSHYLAHCEQQVANGTEWPFESHVETIKRLRQRFDQYLIYHLPEGTFTPAELREFVEKMRQAKQGDPGEARKISVANDLQRDTSATG